MTHSNSSLGILLGIAAFVVIIAGIHAAEAILIPFLLAVFIAVIISPLLFWLERHKIPTTLGIILSIILILGVAALITTIIGTSFNDFSRGLPTYQTQLKQKLGLTINWLNKWGLHIPSNDILRYINPDKVMQFTSSILKSVGNIFSNTFLIILTVIFILAEATTFPEKIKAVWGDGGKAVYGFNKFLVEIKRYFVIKTLISLLTGILIWLWLWIIEVDYALLWGLLAFLLNYIPNIGSILAAVPAVLLALVQLGFWPAIMALIGYLTVNIIIGNWLEPSVMGKGMGLSTLVVFLSLIFWGWVLGPVGMLLSVPLTMTAKIALDSRDDTRWMGMLLGSNSD